jgi:F-type H+-transporting ATPase subunit b
VPTSQPVIAASSGKFLITPSLGLMIWTLLVFGISMFLLGKFAFPAIRDALGRRQKAIEDSIDTAERTRVEAEQLLTDYRERLREARGQADEIVTRARQAAEEHEREAVEAARVRGENLIEQSRRDIELATARALAEIRDEVTNLTILAAEKVTRKTLDGADQRRLVEEALAELDFSTLASSDN